MAAKVCHSRLSWKKTLPAKPIDWHHMDELNYNVKAKHENSIETLFSYIPYY